jgi:hypothetical protein
MYAGRRTLLLEFGLELLQIGVESANVFVHLQATFTS